MSDICQAFYNIRRIIGEVKPPEDKLREIGWELPDEPRFYSTKDLLPQQATESGKSKFKLLATMNSLISIFEWCDKECNFVGMCLTDTNTKYTEADVVYSLEDLPEVIDNAERWLKSVKEDFHMSGSPFMISTLQIMSL